MKMRREGKKVAFQENNKPAKFFYLRFTKIYSTVCPKLIWNDL